MASLRRDLEKEEPILVAQSEADKPLEPRGALDFRDTYDRWFNVVSRWVHVSVGAEREDLVQDIFLIVHRRLPDFDGKNVAGWLYKITRRRVRDFRRLAWVRAMLFGSDTLSENLPHGDASPAESLQTKEKRAMLERMLLELKDSDREALVMFELDGLTGIEIAQIQDVSLNTVWGRIYKARRKLKAALAREWDGLKPDPDVPSAVPRAVSLISRPHKKHRSGR